MFLQTGLNRRQMKQICEKFGCKKKEFAICFLQIVYAKEMIRVPTNKRKQVNQ